MKHNNENNKSEVMQFRSESAYFVCELLAHTNNKLVYILFNAQHSTTHGQRILFPFFSLSLSLSVCDANAVACWPSAPQQRTQPDLND